jgi:hypothetical protein
MKKFAYILLLLLGFSGCISESYSVDRSNISGAYFSKEEKASVIKGYVATEECSLNLNADSSFAIFIQNADSDFPTEFSGKWKTTGLVITIADTTEYKAAPFRLTINANGSLTGKYNNHNFVFNKKMK